MALMLILVCWQLACVCQIVPSYMLPSPIEVGKALLKDFSTILFHARFTLLESFYGLLIGIVLAFFFATLMDRFQILDQALHPIMIITQTIPTIAIAPILVLWMGFGMAPKITLVVITTFFPITVGLLDGYKSVDQDAIRLLQAMGANRLQIFCHVKFPFALPQFFSGLKISASYAVVGAVVSEWLGGFNGLGVYMTRVKKAYAFDKMFAVIIFIVVISLLLLLAVNLVKYVVMPWLHVEKGENMNKGHKKYTTTVVAMLCVTAVLGGVSAGHVQAADKKITFCLDWTPNTNHTGLYAALANGYYKDAGLDVQIVQPPEDGASLMCASGQAQFAIQAQDTMASSLALDEPLGITAVAAVIQHNTSGILSRAGEGLDKPAGLTGKTYATWESPIELAMMQNVVNADGGNFEEVTLIPNNITDEPAALAAHQTDAVWVFEGWSAVMAQLEEIDCDYFAFADIDPVFDYYTPVIIANNDYLEANPEQAKAFMEATAKGYEFAAEHPQEAAQMLIDGDNTGSLSGAEDLIFKSQEFLSARYIDDAESWGVIDPDRWNAFYKWLYENGLCEKDLTDVGFSNDYLPQ